MGRKSREKRDRREKLTAPFTALLTPDMAKIVSRMSTNGKARVYHLGLESAELDEYRKATDMDEITALDRKFFEVHKTAITFERPKFPDDLPPGPGMLGTPGSVIVIRITDSLRARVCGANLEYN